MDEIITNEKRNKNKKQFIPIAILLAIIIGAIGFFYWQSSSNKIYVEKAEVSADVISLAPKIGGQLNDTFVKEGDEVTANTPVARVGNDLVKTKVAGIILSIRGDNGALVGAGQAVATMIDKNELKVVGQVPEDKGLKDIKVGQQASFTVDAFGSKTYYGTVDEISPVSRDASLTFNISDKRAVKDFDIKIRFDLSQYPELKQGMSAQIWVLK